MSHNLLRLFYSSSVWVLAVALSRYYYSIVGVGHMLCFFFFLKLNSSISVSVHVFVVT